MGWDKDRPDGGKAFKVGDDAIRENFTYIEDTFSSWFEFGPGSDHTGRPKADVGGIPVGPQKVGYHTFNAAVPAVHYYDGTDLLTIWGVPLGATFDWFGSVNDVPPGYRMCCAFDAVLAPMGAGGTTVNGVAVPNLGGKWMVGLDPTNADYDTVAETGGSEEHVVEEENIEQFDLDPVTVRYGVGSTNAAAGGLAVNSGAGYTTLQVGQAGADPIDHRPPYYVACKLILVGV